MSRTFHHALSFRAAGSLASTLLGPPTPPHDKAGQFISGRPAFSESLIENKWECEVLKSFSERGVDTWDIQSWNSPVALCR
ncbi:hypothetical protein JYU34_021568 [Plutella xylostella]|uniref:Uncharacterized protein n=1 Tax=Plutella xylostella TaxID=51655 RepID=A0ABQ7PTW1_PLUXY|nr:hypothetical protein JYU34_021568 [Plutella xylostella]